MIAFDVADVAGSTDATAAEVCFSASLLLSLHKKQSCAIGWSSRLRSREWWQGQSAKELCILRRGGSGQSAERTQQRGDYDMFELEHRQSEPIKLTMLDIGGAVRGSICRVAPRRHCVLCGFKRAFRSIVYAKQNLHNMSYKTLTTIMLPGVVVCVRLYLCVVLCANAQPCNNCCRDGRKLFDTLSGHLEV